MDSLIHYEGRDIARTIAALAARTRRRLSSRRAAHPCAHGHARGGRFFPRGNRAPAIVPISQHAIGRRLGRHAGLKTGESRAVEPRRQRLLYLAGAGGRVLMNRASAALVKAS